MNDFAKLHEMYKNRLKADGIPDQFVLPEDMLREQGSTGVYTMLAVLYANHEMSPNLLDPDAWLVDDRPETVGLSPEVREVASRLLGREVEREDRQTLFSIRADRIELSDEAFDKLNAMLDNPDPKPNRALINLMSRKKNWS